VTTESFLKALESEPDERLRVEEARQDPARFAELYENNFERVYAYIAHRVRNRDEAEDLTAEVFHQALVSLPQFAWRGTPFIAWLLGIAAHTLADRWHRTNTLREVDSVELDQLGTEDDVERRAMLYQLVETLPPDQKLVIVQRFVAQKSIREVAAELGRSAGAVKQLQLRALQSLRDRIRSNHG
jgi:RNA polymerase sigma-70 factor (ECF subfamily)